jgi:hypothetical protein
MKETEPKKRPSPRAAVGGQSKLLLLAMIVFIAELIDPQSAIGSSLNTPCAIFINQ